MLFRVNESIDSKLLKSKLDKKVSDRGLDSYSFEIENCRPSFENEYFIDENIPIIGGRWHVVFAKKIVRRCTRFVAKHIIKQQNAINYEMLRKITELDSVIKSQRLEIKQLKNELKKAKK